MSEWQFIFGVLVFYGFLIMLFTLGDGYLYGLSFGEELTFATPVEPTGDVLIDLINGTSQILSNIWTMFSILFITPLASSFWWLGFINWATFGTTLYLFIRIIRGGG